jgi:hypothetical protein
MAGSLAKSHFVPSLKSWERPMERSEANGKRRSRGISDKIEKTVPVTEDEDGLYIFLESAYLA